MGVSEGLVLLSCFACLEAGMASHQALLLGSQGLHLELGRHSPLHPTPWVYPDVRAKISLVALRAAGDTVTGVALPSLSEAVTRAAGR